MLKINNIVIKNVSQLIKTINLFDNYQIEDNDNYIESYLKIKYILNDKAYFLQLLKKYAYKFETFVLYINSNNINENCDLVRLDNFMNYVKLNPKDRLSDNYQLLRFGIINKEIRNKYGLTEEKFIKKYGESIGKTKYINFCNKQKEVSIRTLPYWLNKGLSIENAKKSLKEYQSSRMASHFNNKTCDYINNFNKTNSPWCIEFYIKNGHTKDEAKLIIKKSKQEQSKFSLKYYLKNGYTEDEANKAKTKYWYEHCYNNTTQTSKESLLYFKPFIEKLENLKASVYYGNSNKKEYFIYDKILHKYNFYDLTILYNEIKLIIEYNGEKFHPNKEKLSNEEWNQWTCLFSNESADIKYKKDKYKKELAIKNGFIYLEIWSSETPEEINNKIKIFIEQNLNITI